MAANPGRAWILLGLLTAAYVAWTWSGELTTMRADSAVYLLSARHYAFWRSVDPIAAEVARNSQFPPLYPLLLALGGAAGDHAMRFANLATVGLSLASWLMLFAWLRRKALGAGSCSLIVLVAACLPEALRLALNPQSEHLYVPLSLAALVAMDEFQRSARREAFQLAALAVAAAMLTRTIGVALVLPLAFLALRSRDRKLMVSAGLALVPALLWKAVHRPVAAYEASITQFYLNAPIAMIGKFLLHSPAVLLDQLAVNLTKTPWLRAPALAMSALLFAAAAWRAARGRPDGLYVAGYVAIVIVWPFPAEDWRFLFAIAPILIGQLALTIVELSRAGSRLALVIPVVALVLLAPNLAWTATRFHAGLSGPDPRLRSFPEWYGSDPRQAAVDAQTMALHVDAMHRIGHFVDPQDCVYTVQPAPVAFFSHRRTVETPPREVDDATFAHLIDAQGCRYAFVMTVITGPNPEPMYPARRYAEHLQVIDTAPPEAMRGGVAPVAFLARLR